MTAASCPPTRGMWGLVGLFLVSGTVHLLRPQVFEAIVPRRLGHRRALVYISGLVELGCAVGMSVPATRRPAGLVSTGLLVAIFPANVQMAADALAGRSRVVTVLTVARLPLQLPLVRTAYRTWSPAPR